MKIAPSMLLPLLLLLLLFPPAAMHSAVSPVTNEHTSDVYIVFVSRADYVDSADYDVRLLASVVGSIEEAKTAMIYHYSGLGFAAKLTASQANQLSKKEGIAVSKDKIYHVDKDSRLPRSFEENI